MLALAMRRWSSAEEGSGQLLLFAGEAGVGKSRLLGEFEEQVGGRARMLSTAAFPRDAESAGGVLFDLVAALRRAGATGFAARLRKALHEVGDSGPAPHRMLVAELCEILLDLVDEGAPVLLTVEDLHWVDELSLEVLGRLAVAARSTSLLLVGSYRSDELYPRSPLRRWRSRLVGQRLAEEVRLQRLDAVGTAGMAAAIIGHLPSSAFTDALFERSDGIPLHIEELIVGGADARVPDTVAEAMLARVEALAPRTRLIATAAAVIGRSFDLDLLAAITSESPDAVDAALLELAERRLVLPRADGVSFDFRHALIRETIYDSIPPNRRRALHAEVAAAAAAAGFRDSFLSDQFERAGQKANAYRSARTAAAAATHLSAHREAAEFYRGSLRLFPPPTPPGPGGSLTAGAAAYWAAPHDNEGAEEEYALAVDLYRRLGDEVAAAGLVPGLMAVRHLLGVDLDARVTLARDALSRLGSLTDGGPDLVRGRLLAALAAAYMLDRRLEESLDLARQAARVIPEGAIEERVNTDATLGSVLVFAGQSADGWTTLERSIVDGEEAGVEAETARAYRMIGSSTSVLVEYDRGEAWLPRGISYAARTERWNDHHYLAAHLAHLHWATGDWAAAELSAQQALADGRGGITTRVTALHVLGYLALGRDQAERARTYLEEAREIGERMRELQRLSPALWGLAELALLEGNPATAVELCEIGYEGSATVSDAAYLFPFLLTGVRALLSLRDRKGAGNWATRCGDLLRLRGIPGTLPALAHAEGLLELAAGSTGSARGLLESADAGWRRHRRFWEGAWVLADLARCAKRSRRPADAASLVARLRTAADTVGARALDRIADDVGAAPAEPPTGPLTARELDVAALVASGSTNREIATALDIAPKTAAAHIEHILTKLGAARRSEIAAWAARELHPENQRNSL